MTIKIIMHALRMVFADLGGSLRVTGPLFLLAQATILALTYIYFGSFDFEAVLKGEEFFQAPSLGYLLFSLVGLIAYIILSTWVAVVWHRYVLLGETGMTYPKGRVGSYFWIGLGYALVAIIPGMVVMVVLTAVFDVSNATAPLIEAAMIIAIVFILFRISMGLPGLCVDNKITLQESWVHTRPLAGAILGLGVALAALTFVATMVMGQQTFSSSIPGLIVSVIVAWVQFVVGLSVLTTIYGVAIEGRELS